MSLIEFGQRYSFKNLFPELYSDIYLRVDELLSGDKEKINDRFDTLGIIFVNKPSKESSYIWGKHVIEVSLPDYILGQVKNIDRTVDFDKLKILIMNDFALKDGLFHEIAHSLQGLQYSDKQNDYRKQWYEVGYDNISYEKQAVIEALIMAKKLGTKFEDLDESLQYHLWYEFKKRHSILESLDDLRLSSEKNKVKIKEEMVDIINKKLDKDFKSYEVAMRYLIDFFKEKGYRVDLTIVINRAIALWNQELNTTKFSKAMYQKMMKTANGLDRMGMMELANKVDQLIMKAVRR